MSSGLMFCAARGLVLPASGTQAPPSHPPALHLSTDVPFTNRLIPQKITPSPQREMAEHLPLPHHLPLRYLLSAYILCVGASCVEAAA